VATGLFSVLFALTVKVLRVWIIIKITSKCYNLVKYISISGVLLKINLLRDYLTGVDTINLSMSHKPSLSPA
jgi:hypothetical protein